MKIPWNNFAEIVNNFPKGVNDGAGALVLASEDALKEYNLTPLARLVGYGIAGVEPRIM